MDTTTYKQFMNALNDLLGDAVDHYQESAPTVSRWADDLYIRLGENVDGIVLSEITFAHALKENGQWEHPNYAANRLYHLLDRLGRDTTGLAGF